MEMMRRGEKGGEEISEERGLGGVGGAAARVVVVVVRVVLPQRRLCGVWQ